MAEYMQSELNVITKVKDLFQKIYFLCYMNRLHFIKI